MRTAGIVGVIGAGAMGIHHARSLGRLGRAVLVLARSGTSAVPADLVVRELDELLARCSVIDVCTPTDTHRELADAALSAGRDVIVEKPLAGTSADAEHLVRVAGRTGRQLLPAHVARYAPETAALAARATAGEIGELRRLRFVREVPARAGWFGDDARSGGPILDLMIHDLDVARWVAGEVAGVLSASDVRDGEVRRATVSVRHESGAVSEFRAAWLAGPGAALRVEQGAEGSMGEIRTTVDVLDPRATDAMLQDLLDAVAGDRPARVCAEDGAAAVRLAERAAAVATLAE